MSLWVWLFFSQCLAFPVCFCDSAEIPLTLFLFLCLSHCLLSHCLYWVECAFYGPWLKGFSQVTAVCTAGYQCWSWLIVIQAGGMHQEEKRSIIKSFSKLWLRFISLLKNFFPFLKKCLLKTLSLHWKFHGDVAISRKGKRANYQRAEQKTWWAPLGSKSFNAPYKSAAHHKSGRGE